MDIQPGNLVSEHNLDIWDKYEYFVLGLSLTVYAKHAKLLGSNKELYFLAKTNLDTENSGWFLGSIVSWLITT